MKNDTTAQLRQTQWLIQEVNNICNTPSQRKQILEAVADYISQLELPEKMKDENYYKENAPLMEIASRRGYNQALKDTASTLQKAVEELRG